jgi:hypothetical protein
MMQQQRLAAGRPARTQGPSIPARSTSSSRARAVRAAAAAPDAADPLLIRAARGEAVERAPCWMMRQAGRYQAAYRELAIKHPSFRARSETTDLIVDISLQVRAFVWGGWLDGWMLGRLQLEGGSGLGETRSSLVLIKKPNRPNRTHPADSTPTPKTKQPFRSFRPDGVILFSDILTPLPAVGVPFEIDDTKGPLIDSPIRSMEQVGGMVDG